MPVPLQVRPTGGLLLPPVLTAAYRALASTWCYRFVGRETLDAALAEGPAVLAFWHGEQMAMVRAHAGMGLLGLASTSPDGELLARVIASLGYRVARGSTTRGGAAALRECRRLLQAEGLSPALAVDGPRGPRHHVHPGALLLSAETGRPVVFGVSRARPAVHLPSWDRFVVPAPFARIAVAYGRMDPTEPGRASVEDAARALGDRMESLADRAFTPGG